MWLLESLGVELKSGVVRAELRLSATHQAVLGWIFHHSFVEKQKDGRSGYD